MTKLKLGSKPINFSLKGIDEKYYSLEDFDDKKYLAIMFSCNHCPYVIASEREFVAIQTDFEKNGFGFVVINPNVANPKYPGDSFKNMKERAEEKKFNFPYLADDTQEVARTYMAGKTPEIFLYDENRDLVYYGRINDNPRNPSEISRQDLRIALEELTSGNPISVPETLALGCSIKYIEN